MFPEEGEDAAPGVLGRGVVVTEPDDAEQRLDRKLVREAVADAGVADELPLRVPGDDGRC